MVNCLPSTVTLSVSGFQYHIDGVSTNGQVYYMGNGVYNINGNLGANHPSKFIAGTNGVGVNEETTVEPNPSDYLTTARTLTVKGDFVRMSLYCQVHGSMGGQNIFAYSAACSGAPASAPVAAPTAGPVFQPSYYGR